MNPEEIRDGDGTLLALLVRDWSGAEGVRWFTDPSQTLQLGWMRRPAGHVILPHEHREEPRLITAVAEVLLLRRGVLKVELYGQTEVVTRTMQAGDMIVLYAGGHGFEGLTEFELVEVRQGPYLGRDAEKRFLGQAAEGA